MLYLVLVKVFEFYLNSQYLCLHSAVSHYAGIKMLYNKYKIFGVFCKCLNLHDKITDIFLTGENSVQYKVTHSTARPAIFVLLLFVTI